MNKLTAIILVSIVFAIFVLTPIVLAIVKGMFVFLVAALIGLVSVGIFVKVFASKWNTMK